MKHIKTTLLRIGLASTALLLFATIIVRPMTASAAFDPSPWTHLTPIIPTGYTPVMSTLCADGSITCVDQSIANFQTTSTPLVASCDHNLLFPFFYQRVTQAYRDAVAADPNYMQDNAYFNRLDTIFTSYYFNQRQAWLNNDTANVSVGWQQAFQAADSKSVTSMGDLFLTLNAHINHDLTFTMDQAGLFLPDGRSTKVDYDKVNQLLYAQQNIILSEASRRFDPSLAPTTPDSSLLTYQVIAGMRENAWQYAQQLKLAEATHNPLLYQTVQAAVDAQTLATAAALKVTFASSASQTATRDNFCAVHHNDL